MIVTLAILLYYIITITLMDVTVPLTNIATYCNIAIYTTKT